MSFRVVVRAVHPYRAFFPPSAWSRKWLSGYCNDESLKTSATIGGKTIKFVRSGDGEHVVLCMPGALGSSLTDFKPQIEGLDKKAFTVIAWDPPGYGHSRPPNRDFSPGFLNRDADYAVDLMKSLDLPKFSVLGWSDGGITSIFLAEKYPQNVRKMVIWGTNAYITGEAVIHKKIQYLRMCSMQKTASMIELYGEDGFRTMWEQRMDEFVRIFREKGGDICKTELKSIQCPLFVLHGGKDIMVAPEHARYIIDNVPGSQLLTFEEGRHDIHLQYAKEFNSLVHKFLTSEQSSVTADHISHYPLPPFWSKNPATWFAKIEAHFQLSNIEDDLTKYNCVLSQLPCEYAERVEDVICKPPHDGKYDLLKTELINRIKMDRFQQSLSNIEIGNKKPSEFLSHLRYLAGNEASESLLRPLWLKGLPKHVQDVVTTQSAPLDALARLADKVAEIPVVSTSTLLPSNEHRGDATSNPSMVSMSPPEEQRKTLLEEHVTTARTRGECPKRDLLNETTLPKYDIYGLPLPGSTIREYMPKDFQLTSRYHLLLSEFPGILYRSEVLREPRYQTRHRVLLTSEEPVFYKFPARLSERENSIAEEIINSMIRQGTARPSASCYAAPLKIKKDLYVDAPGWYSIVNYKALNRKTASDRSNDVDILQISDCLHGCNVFSVVNLWTEALMIPMVPEDAHKTAIFTTFGRFEFPFMPRGLRNAAKTRQKVLDEVLQGLPFCFNFLSSALVFSLNHDEHLEHMRALFERLSLNGILVNPSTSTFGEPRVEFYNYSVSRDGCLMLRDKIVKQIEDIPCPGTYADLEKFLTIMRHFRYRAPIPASAEDQLVNLCNVPAGCYVHRIPWTPQLKQAFEECKSAIARAPTEDMHFESSRYAYLSSVRWSSNSRSEN